MMRAMCPGAVGPLALVLTLMSLGGAGSAAAQDSPPTGDVLSPEGNPVLAADQIAQQSIGGFRVYLERIRPTDPDLYAALDPTLDRLERRLFFANLTFGVSAVLGIGGLAVGIPFITEDVNEGVGIGLTVAGAATLALGLLIQAILRPGQSDLLALIDEHDRFLGRR
ncbi:MAG: hypothetical protein ACFCGT_18220 [Sandaracinaceae bacterium]